MSYQIQASSYQGQNPLNYDTSSESEDDNEETPSDWESDIGQGVQAQSLFDNSLHPTPEAVVDYDRSKHGFDLKELYHAMHLDMYGLIRLVNYIRKKVSKIRSKLKPGSKSLFGEGDQGR
jgi:hypothetical protein